MWPLGQRRGKKQYNGGCLCTTVQFLLQKKGGAAFIGVAYSTGQLGTKTKENHGWVGQFETPLELSSTRPTGSF